MTGITRLLVLVNFKVILRAGGVEVEAEAKVDAGEAGVEASEGVCSCPPSFSNSDSEDSSDNGSESESENVAEMSLVRTIVLLRLGGGGLRDLVECWRFRFVSPFRWAGSDLRRWTVVWSLSAATLAGKTTGGGEADAADRAGVEFRLSATRDLFLRQRRQGSTAARPAYGRRIDSPL